MGLDSLLAKLSAQPATSATAPENQALRLQTQLSLGCTSATPATSQNIKVEDKTDLPRKAPEPEATTKPKKRQVTCRAFKITRIHAVTRAELCLDRQGPHCGKCELRQTDSNH